MRFILIDSILELEPGRSTVAVREIRREEDYFQDHFPGFPVVPGVLLTEMMAQTGGKCLDAERSPRGKAMLARIRSASFRKWVVPPATAHVHARIKSSQKAFATAECHVEVEGAKVAEADLLFSFLPLDQLAEGFRDEILERFLSDAGKEASDGAE